MIKHLLKTVIQSYRIQTIVIVIAAASIYIMLSNKLIHYGTLNADEGFYALAAKKVMKGSIPYRDFAYSRMPALPYINGLAMSIAGFGFVRQRLVNAVWGMLALGILVIPGIRYGKYRSWIWGVLAVTVSPLWMHYICMGKSYSAANLFLIIAVLGIFLDGPFPVRLLLAAGGGILAVGCRLSVLPAVIILWGVFFIGTGSRKEKGITLGSIIAGAAALFLPFYFAAPENFSFWNLHYHLQSTFNRRGLEPLLEVFHISPIVVIIIVVGVVYSFLNVKNSKVQTGGVLLAAWIGIIFQLCLKSSYGENVVPFIAMGSIASLSVIQSEKWLFWIKIGVVISPGVYLFLDGPDTSQKWSDIVTEPAAYIRANTDREGKILTPFPLIAVEADREVFKRVEMGKFAVTLEMDKARAERLHLLTFEELLQIIEEREPAAIVLTKSASSWNFNWSVPSLQSVPKGKGMLFYRSIMQKYSVVFENQIFRIMVPVKE